MTLRRGFDSHLTLQKLEVFCVVADLLSVTRAAQHLYITQPVVTAHIRSLEDKLGARLIRREGRGIALTVEGLRVLKWARDVVTRTRELERELGGSISNAPGQAVVSSSMSVGTYLLPGMICDFQLSHPDGKVELSISNPLIALESLRAGACDFAVTIVSPDQNLDGFAVYPLWTEPLLLVSSPTSRLVGNEAQREQISHLPFISTTSSPVMQQLEDGQLRANGIGSRRVVMALGHPEAQMEAVRRDVGVCFFLESSARADLARGALRVVKTPGFELRIALYMVHRKDKEFSQYQLELKQHIESARPMGVTAFEDRERTPPTESPD
jgi:DNA-binding transcriptional LysR family regulator